MGFQIQGSKVKPGGFTPRTGGISAAGMNRQHSLLPVSHQKTHLTQKASARS